MKEEPELDDRVVFVGLARNCAHSLPRLLDVVGEVGGQLTDWGYVFVESDSYDGTLRVLNRFDRRYARGIVQTYGKLRGRHASRTERMAYLRNECLRLIWDSPRLSGFEYAIIMDMDAANHGLDAARLAALVHERPRTWTALFANQSDRYADIWALRHADWSPDDCWARVEDRPPGMSREEAIRRFVDERRVRLDPSAGRIAVDSAFGGLGIYDLQALRDVSYSGTGPEGRPICEHVPFHDQLRERGGRLFIEPSLINGTGTQDHKPPRITRWVNLVAEKFRKRG